MSSRPGDERLPGLWQRWKDEGDVEARDELLERYLPLVSITVRLIALERMTLEDRQDMECCVVLRLLKSIENYNPSRGRFENYAVGQLRFAAFDYLRDNAWETHHARKAVRRGEDVFVPRLFSSTELAEQTERVADPRPGPEDLVIERMGRERLDLEIRALAPYERGVMEDIYRLGLTYRESARRRGLSPQTIPLILRRATQRIRERLEKDE